MWASKGLLPKKIKSNAFEAKQWRIKRFKKREEKKTKETKSKLVKIILAIYAPCTLIRFRPCCHSWQKPHQQSFVCGFTKQSESWAQNLVTNRFQTVCTKTHTERQWVNRIEPRALFGLIYINISERIFLLCRNVVCSRKFPLQDKPHWWFLWETLSSIEAKPNESWKTNKWRWIRRRFIFVALNKIPRHFVEYYVYKQLFENLGISNCLSCGFIFH